MSVLEEKVLDDGVKLVVEESHSYHRTEYVRLTAPDPRWNDHEIQAVVCGSLSSYADHKPEPEIDVRHQHGFNRAQWDVYKKLADRAWDEYERRFGAAT